MKILRPLMAGVFLFSVGACATAPKPDYSKFFEHHPRSVLIVPPINKTTAVEAPIVFDTTVTRPFAERGYYIYPVFLTRDILNDLGLSDEGLIAQAQPQRFREIFGADAVLFVTVNTWTTTYLVLASSVTVEANYKLVDTATGEVIWERTERVAEQSGGGSNPIAMAISAALTALTVDYRPLARRTNILVVDKPGQGLPAGPYRSEYKQDYSNYRD
ncbi:MAG: GNA1162 family protein [Candidatus Methylomirabilales bacterium]